VKYCAKVLPPGQWVPCCLRESIAFEMMIGFAVSLTLSPMEQKSPNGLSLTSQFVDRLFSLACTHIQLQAANYWDPVKAAAAGGKTFPSPVPLSHYRLSHFFLGVPEAGPGTNLS
jgi:hypothetical protein